MEKKLLKQSKWLRIFKLENGDDFFESRFLVDGLQISLNELTTVWQTASDREKWEFVLAYAAKPDFSEEDEKNVDFLMEHGSEPTWLTLAGTLTKSADQHKAVGFLLKLIENASRYPKANYFQALEAIASLHPSETIVAALEVQFKRYQTAVKAYAHTLEVISQSDEIWDYLACCKTLLTLTRDNRYMQAIDEYRTAADPRLRDWAVYLRTREESTR